jgi:hypothetical protein
MEVSAPMLFEAKPTGVGSSLLINRAVPTNPHEHGICWSEQPGSEELDTLVEAAKSGDISPHSKPSSDEFTKGCIALPYE